jgi:hypothetical protein
VDEKQTLLNPRLTDDGLVMEGMTTRQSFGDARWHIEFRLPYQPHDSGQDRGNSGAYVMGVYEVQMLDSFGLEGRDNECGGVYSVKPPAVNMCLPPLAWQTYDIDVTAPRFENGGKVKDARMTVRHNGVVIHDDIEVAKVTPGGVRGEEGPTGPLCFSRITATRSATATSGCCRARPRRDEAGGGRLRRGAGLHAAHAGGRS